MQEEESVVADLNNQVAFFTESTMLFDLWLEN